MANGLGSNSVLSVTVSGSTIYAVTTGGLSISGNGGSSFANYTMGGNIISCVAVLGSTIYVGTNDGVAISTNGGSQLDVLRRRAGSGPHIPSRDSGLWLYDLPCDE